MKYRKCENEFVSLFVVPLTFQCVFEVDKEKGLTLTELADGVTVEDVLVSTGCEINVAEKIKKMGDVTQSKKDSE